MNQEDLRAHVRDEAPPSDAIVVLRGGPDTLESSDTELDLRRLLHALGSPEVTRTMVRDGGRAMVTVDITADLNDEDETGFVWTFLDEAHDPSLMTPGAIVVAGDADVPAVAEVVDIVDKPAGKIVHLRLLPGVIEDYEALVRRALTPSS